MKRVVYKVTVAVAEEIELSLPRDARIIHIGDQFGQGTHLTFWFIRDPSQQSFAEKHRFLVFGTGQTFEADRVGPHRATVVTAAGCLVWHIFSAKEDS